MTQLLSLSRAARLAGVTRAELQRRIRGGEIQTFEGEVAVSDLLRVYPRVSLEKTGMLERVERIKARAVPRTSQDDTVLPSAEVLLSRIRSLSEALTHKVALVDAQEALLEELRQRLAALAPTCDAAEAGALGDWLDRRRAEIAAQPVDEGRTQLLAKDTFLRIMSASVKIIPSGHEFFVDGTESILDAAVRSGLRLSYGCSSGNCGECKARVVSGEVWKLGEHDYVLSEREKQMGYVLTCCNTAVTDVVLEAAEARSAADLPEQQIQAQIRKLEPDSDTLLQLHVQTPRTQTLRFMAGQQARLQLESGASAQLPIASCPCNGRNLQFSVRLGEDAFSRELFSQAKARQRIDLAGPYGRFVLREEATEPAVFVAVGDGIAPIKSLIEHAISIDNVVGFHLYWTVAADDGHHYRRWCRALRESLDNFAFTPLVEADADDLLALLRADLSDLADVYYYLAGEASLLHGLRRRLLDLGVAEERIALEVL
ncbi:2Fe-2S iron-sulfur cluster binding domain-containing protein [Thiohalocapsa marina]|uniref:2Fe-2S iron-sulfur cluster binding domain-containing protein n=1 Tax=Thiohalocapsa marina TaxID=424902 RepID=A0A5M8FI84_9GAMM|nr:2Fe-2S iron-sulfur cluster-binding protein [Thiohalocapsa marina]KAA6184407.1 2Fe-2S iron-sulfur cluster binding domain-containing protein [Thiohalocapsa marina]